MSAESPSSWGASGQSLRSVGTSVVQKSVRDLPSLEYRTAHMVSPSAVASPGTGRDAEPASDCFDQPDGARDGLRRIVGKSERQREEEEHLRVGLALDPRVQRWIDGECELALHGGELVDEAVVHEQPAVVTERMAVRLLHRAADRSPDVGEEVTRANVVGDLLEVVVVPRRLDAVEHAWFGVVSAVPPDPEAVAVRRLGTHPRVKALIE